MKRASIFYLATLLMAGAAIAWVLHLGGALPSPGGEAVAVDKAAAAGHAAATNDLTRLFVQLLVIIIASRLMGWLFSRLGQPSVVGEMAAGILLGPSLFGLLAPDIFASVFPAGSLSVLKLLSQVGVCLFMFTVGMELDVSHVRNRAHVAVLVSHASIVIPYLLGVVTAWFLYSTLAAPGAGFTAFALFMGISMSITAFPVLARILQERGLTQTPLGSTGLTCAAVDDVTAWSILAFVVATVRSASVGGWAWSILLVLGFIAVMIWGVKPLLRRQLGAGRLAAEDLSRGTLATVIVVLLLAALSTELIGIHALFGSFLAGTIMPDTHRFRHKLGLRIENFSSVLLLPIFFAFTGLRTQLGLLSGWQDWSICLAIIGVATLGKLGGTAVTARFTGMSWRESLQLGALMNTRGLMELIALNIGYDLGILSPRIFTMLVIMALVTTMMTGPLLTLFARQRVPRGALQPAA
jgi:Kef-type K+ transport system membrane component KefB